MIQIIPCKARFEELVQFAARLNSAGLHHIGFFGEGEADVRSSLAEFLIPPGDVFMLAYDGDKLVGVFGVDTNPEISRAWLFGPLVEHAGWHTVADQLYASVLPLIPANIRVRDMFCDAQNIHIEEFAARHGFPLNSENAVLTLTRDNYKPPPKRKTQVSAYQEGFFTQFEELHKVLFPNASYTAQQMVEKINETYHLFVAVEDGHLLGYHFCKIEPESESGYVDFIGTDESVRGRGIGADLLVAGVDWMLSAPTTRKINLTVNANNIVARNLYEKFGFVTERIMRGYRKQVN
ncbi:MAG: GNAT family N-acetyltransferase [Chloroflexota bacterium]|nr:GNAT family N-acetyltransferase [Chloroflexota bacterium]